MIIRLAYMRVPSEGQSGLTGGSPVMVKARARKKGQAAFDGRVE